MYMKFIRAFTFVELMVTLAVLAIVVSIALPHFHEYLAKLEAQTTHKKIISALNYARSQAALHRQNIVICPSSNFIQCEPNKWQQGYLIFIDQNKNRRIDDNEILIHKENLALKYANLEWRGALSIPSVTYQAMTAMPIGSNGSFYYCPFNGQENKKIILSKMGHTRSEPINQC
ncbi:fimbrial biogenesis protein FimT [Acinetobacter sp. NCu2D-2]|uniref:GspH/FimT family pseudopilin n=1 Tax=Acinetobacter sp. NCu2D-2 TaxID=1608473 RepID=UPI0007CDB458|nr:GspH/FimT family pseudopilin [Acinetobacter sp. NCu2D-2]ANF82416.1 fimbrial biogenesis protein FimT [Acinetobacter sp. NCu2D-2]